MLEDRAMATLTIDLPEAPRAQAAYRLAADCPRCGAPLVLRQNRQTDVLFTGCSAYPGCAFTEPHDPRVQTLSTGVVQAVHTLALQVAQAQTEARQQVTQAQADAQRHVAAERATLDRTVRQLIALAHPDRWPDTPLAHELTVALVALRDTLRPGNPVAPPVGS
jgi:Topoisomerase DNA binding C4 zinc finger